MNLLELASRVRAARVRRNLTLDQVSELSGLGKGLISKVENFRVTPSLPTLAKLCEALGVTMAELLSGLDSSPKLCVVRLEDRVEVERDGDVSDVRYASLAHSRPSRGMDPLELRIPPHGGRRVALTHEGEEFLLVVEGPVLLEYDGENHELAAGDAAYFDAGMPHRILNPGDGEARVLSVNLDRPN
ncbi:MAG: cupin domain-containing protein [Verrucomicrobia bacterium]|nr:cupin domain-containing protein [Verrucomicrobiota bacterium]